MMEPCKQSKPCDALLRRLAHRTASPRSILDEFSREGPFAYVSDDPNWEACERLARSQPGSAIRLVEKVRGMRGRQIRMMAYGAMDNAEDVMREWSKIARTRGAITLGSGSWFFLPGALWEATAFWEVLLRVADRIDNMCLFSPTSDSQGPPELMDDPLRTNWTTVYKWAIKFHLSRTRGDEAALGRMCAKFPRWRDPRFVIEWLNYNGRPPTRDEMLTGLSRTMKKRHLSGGLR